MYAIALVGGKQYRVAQGDKLVVDRMHAEVGSTVEIKDVLMVGGDAVKIGAPHVEGAKVTCEVVDHHLGDKRTTYKFIHRRRWRVERGFRPSLTTLKVTGIEG